MDKFNNDVGMICRRLLAIEERLADVERELAEAAWNNSSVRKRLESSKLHDRIPLMHSEHCPQDCQACVDQEWEKQA